MDKQREMFEAWCTKDGLCGPLKTDAHGNYVENTAQCCWQAWQASLAAQRSQFVADTGIDLKGMVDAGFDANSGKMPSRNIINLPEPGTSEYGSWINKAKDKADQCFASHGSDRFKWLCQFEQQLYKTANSA